MGRSGEHRVADLIPMPQKIKRRKRIPLAVLERGAEMGADLILTEFTDGSLRFELEAPQPPPGASRGGPEIFRIG